uniref:Cyclic nucleotide-binding domain-containing protein 2 n=1 Tax=Ceratitis capitata TaxID=7213 RepID=W8BHV8_CERCA
MLRTENNVIGKAKEKFNPVKRFKQLARSALINQQWLSELAEQQRTKVAVHRPKVTGILTNNEKNLLRKFSGFRTDSERLSLVNLMANLIVFSQIPPKLRARLAPYAYFIIIDPKRKIIEEGRQPATVYFVLNGDIAVTKKEWSSVKNKYIDKLEYICGPGEWLGEIEILENLKRRHTYTSKSEVELLALDRADFERILMPYVKEIWEEKKTAMRYLGYFSFFSNEQVISACQLATLQQFEPYETIYHENKGLQTFVCFVISGTCMILQCLRIKVSKNQNRKQFALTDVVKRNDVFRKVSTAEIRSFMRTKPQFDLTQFSLKKNESESDYDIQQQKKNVMDVKAFKEMCAGLEPDDKGSVISSKFSFFSPTHSFSSFPIEEDECNEHNFTEDQEEDGILSEESFGESEEVVVKSSSYKNSVIGLKLNSEEDNMIYSKESIENHFIDVGRINKGGVIGLGEDMEHRIIVAETKVQCLLLPRYWLFEHNQNPANMWHRQRIQLEINIPSREKLFKFYMDLRKWDTFKNEITSSFKNSGTKLQDIPIMAHIISSGQ